MNTLISFYVNSNKSLIKTLFVNKYVKVDLDKNLLDFLLNGRDLRLNLRSFVLGDGSGNHWTGDPTSAAKSLLGPDKYIGHVRILAEERDVEQNLQRLSIGGQNNEFGLTSVQSLRSLVRALAHLKNKTEM